MQNLRVPPPQQPSVAEVKAEQQAPASAPARSVETQVTATGDNQFEFIYKGVKHQIVKNANGTYTISNDEVSNTYDDKSSFQTFNNVLKTYGINPEDVSFSNETQVTAKPPVTSPTTGNVVTVRNEDGTSYQINNKEHTITKYDSNGNVVEQKDMTSDEQALSTQNLIANLQKPTTQTPPAKVEAEPQPRKIQGTGIGCIYTIAEDGSKKLSHNYVIGNNQAANAFKKGMTVAHGFLAVKPDKNGFYNFRGIKATTPEALSLAVNTQADDIAYDTAIFRDLQSKQSSGESLTAREQKFISNYNNLLNKVGLRLNNNGELEDIQTPRTRFRR